MGRLLEAERVSCGDCAPAQLAGRPAGDFTRLGTPRLFFGVTAGAMIDGEPLYRQHPVAQQRCLHARRKAGFRPDYAVKTYTQILKRLFPRTPVVIGGIEASLRRLTHYDYWSDSLHPSISPTAGPTF